MNVRPKKHLGQHFLVDENIAQKIVGFLDPKIPLVLEVGPGKGVLTKYLIQDERFDPWFVEVDQESVQYLKSQYPQIGSRIINSDFLTLNIREFIENARESGKWDQQPGSRGRGDVSGTFDATGGVGIHTCQLLGNFPYNISSGILFQVLDYRDQIVEVVGMFQQEVARRIAAPPGSKIYGILSVLLQAFYSIDYLMTVSESVFFPKPRVKSAVVRLRRNERTELGCDIDQWIAVVKKAFNQRRKMLRNSLSSIMPPSALQNGDPRWTQRPEQLTWSDFVDLTRLSSHPGEENC